MLYLPNKIVLFSILTSLGDCFIDQGGTKSKANIEDNSTFLDSGRNFILPYIYDIFSMKKNIIASYPFEIAASAIDVFCSSTIIFHRVPKNVMPDIDKMHFQLITPCKNYSVPLLQAEKLWGLKAFNITKKVVMLATGWTDTVNDSATLHLLSEAFLCRQDVNFIIVDAAKYVDTLYKWSALNTEQIGKHIAIGLVHLQKLVSMENIHLIGHSLGAHIMGAAGRTFTQLTGNLIPRITGLDPAKPCFRRNEILPSLQKSDAEFVDIVHTNIGILAKREPIGHVDFYPGGAKALPPGCFTITCAHGRAVEYFAESVYPWSEHNFLANHCNSWQQLKQQSCKYVKNAWMGYVTTSGLQSGIYYVDVNWRNPFGKLAQNNMAVNYKCYSC